MQQHLCIYADLARCYSSEMGHGPWAQHGTLRVRICQRPNFSMRTTDYKPNTCSDKQIVNMNRNVHAESMTSASSFRCVFQAIQHCSSAAHHSFAAHCSAKYASESDSAQGWPYKARFDFRIGSFMSTTQSKWSKDAGKPHQVASPPRGRLRVC